MRKDKAILIKLDAAMLGNWRRAAKSAGLSLSEWIRIRCEGGMIITTAKPPGEKAA